MALDPIRNFAISRVATVPSPASSGTTLVVDTGDGALFPDPASSGAFNVVIYPNGEQPDSSNAEIVRVTARTTDTFTIVRQQEGTSARTITEGDVIMLGITRKVLEDVQNLAVEANDIVTAFANGWQEAGETWTYASADDPTYTFTISGDKTSKYSAGMKIKLTQTTVKYFIITKVAYSDPNTTITVYGGTDYDLAAVAITSPYYSMVKAPQGFPMSPDKWSVVVSDTGTRLISSPTQNVWNNISQLGISIPIGVWDTTASYCLYASRPSAGTADVKITLSTANNSESSNAQTSWLFHRGGTDGSVVETQGTVSKKFVITVTSKTTYYTNILTTVTGMGSIATVGGQSVCIITATCAYL